MPHSRIRSTYKSGWPAWHPICPCCCGTMLGGLGKLAAEGLAHRTEKATEEVGEARRLMPHRRGPWVD